MNFKQWKLGLFIALLIGFFTACGAAAVLDVVFNWKFVFFFVSLVGKDVLLFCKDHPSSIVSFGDTGTSGSQQQFTKSQVAAEKVDNESK